MFDIAMDEKMLDESKCVGCGQYVNQCKFDVRDVFVKTKNPKNL